MQKRYYFYEMWSWISLLSIHTFITTSTFKSATCYRVPSFFSHKIPGYFQVLSTSKWPFSMFYCDQFWYLLKEMNENETRKKNSPYNIDMYILTFQVLSMFSVKISFVQDLSLCGAHSRLFIDLDR